MVDGHHLARFPGRLYNTLDLASFPIFRRNSVFASVSVHSWSHLLTLNHQTLNSIIILRP